MNQLAIELNTRALLNYLQQSVGKVDSAAAKIIRRGANEGAREAKRHAPKADSTLTNAINAKQKALTHQQILAPVHYAKYIEEGTGRGGWVPEQTIMDWLTVKGIRPDDENMSMEQLAYLIQTKIFYNGTPAQPFLSPAAQHIKKTLPALSLRILTAELAVKGELK
ncbi:HK97 gp10 family phage protein [Alteromonas sp. K632G]|jgi:HK97 gp10 family phage protein|uniref:HK97-gp10 family putative phage morphogenesis protein n=1 Tax=Alteromonas sp. K632G TaxID=2820757 RepID=UPI001AD62F56|nr:HK97-gp10 family putative phage morphogenesis protein [Alteromonas sp. K632G]MBO7920928.1 HK97 gp10 family phage protein [Alteromonas sp. K632G]